MHLEIEGTPLPARSSRGEGEKIWGPLTQGGSRSSLGLGYNQVIPTEGVTK